MSGMVMPLTFGDFTETVHCYFPIIAFIGDIKNNDMYAGRVMSHSAGLPRLYFQCMCHYDDMDNEDCPCETFTVAEYHSLVRGCQAITKYDPESGRFFGGSASEIERSEYLRNYERDPGFSSNILGGPSPLLISETKD